MANLYRNVDANQRPHFQFFSDIRVSIDLWNAFEDQTSGSRRGVGKTVTKFPPFTPKTNSLLI